MERKRDKWIFVDFNFNDILIKRKYFNIKCNGCGKCLSTLKIYIAKKAFL